MRNPKTSLEIERKYEVPAQTELPNLVDIAAITRVEHTGVHQLDAAYFDTSDFALAANGRALRFRSGGHDSGWHVKHRTEAGMRETQWPSEGDVQNIHSLKVPAQVQDSVRDVIADVPMHMIATISTHRTTTLLFREGEREAIAEVADDLVTTVDARTSTERSWREWEVELVTELSPEEANTFFAAVESALLAAGAQPSKIAAKLQRALGHG